MSELPRRVLVTGADGVIGRAVVSDLVDAGCSVTALSLAFDSASRADRWVVGDARDAALVMDAMTGVDAVVHLAAIRHPELARPREVFTTNVSATFTVLSIAGECGVGRAVIASSVHATGLPFNRRGALPRSFPIDENTHPEIDDAYSLSKATDELTLDMAARRWGLSGVALRLPLTATTEYLDLVAEMDAADPTQRLREGWAHLTLGDCTRTIRAALLAEYTGAHVLCVASDETLLDSPTMSLLAEFAPGVPLTASIPGRSPAVDTSAARRLLGSSLEKVSP